MYNKPIKNKSIKKMKKPLKIKPVKEDINVAISIFENKKLTILEALIAYLRQKQMKYVEISNLLNRDQRNIWSIYSKTQKNKYKLKYRI